MYICTYMFDCQNINLVGWNSIPQICPAPPSRDHLEELKTEQTVTPWPDFSWSLAGNCLHHSALAAALPSAECIVKLLFTVQEVCVAMCCLTFTLNIAHWTLNIADWTLHVAMWCCLCSYLYIAHCTLLVALCCLCSYIVHCTLNIALCCLCSYLYNPRIAPLSPPPPSSPLLLCNVDCFYFCKVKDSVCSVQHNVQCAIFFFYSEYIVHTVSSSHQFT